MSVSINGRSCPQATISGPAAAFDFRCPVDAQSQAPLEIAIEVDRTVRLPNDGRELGVALASAGIEP